MVLGLKAQRSRSQVTKCIFHINDYHDYVTSHLTDNSNTARV